MVMVMVTVEVRLPLGLGVALLLLMHIWGLLEQTGQSASLSAGRLSAKQVCPPKTMSGLIR